MKKAIALSIVAAFATPAIAMAQGDKNSEIRLAKLEKIVVTAEKQQPAGYQPDAATAALLAEIEKAK